MSLTPFQQIEKICTNSNGCSQYFRYGSLGYKYSVAHWLQSSCEVAEAAVEPGNDRVQDIEKIIEVIGNTDLKFAVKGGGHATNPSFSSVKNGLQISMVRFNKLEYDQSKNTLTIGSGCLWDEVYRYLIPFDRTVVGGAGAAGVGVAGWLLGGGYSLRSNQYGLGVDNILEIGVVLPSGKHAIVDATTDKELFYALRGGGNNFGIVTHFVLKTFKETGVYGGVLSYTENYAGQACKAIVDFIGKSKDPKAAVVGAFRYTRAQGKTAFVFTVQCFYGAPEAIGDPFREFLNINHTGSLTSTNNVALDTQFSFLHFVPTPPSIEEIELSINSNYPPMEGIAELNQRARWGCVMVSTFTSAFIDKMGEEAKRLGGLMNASNGGLRVVLDIWPFLGSIFHHGRDTAWPPNSERVTSVFPMLVLCYWENSDTNDNFWIGNMKQTIETLQSVAQNMGISSNKAPVYGNTTLEDTSPKAIYQGDLDELSRIRGKYDSKGVMNKTGGFKIPISTTNIFPDKWGATDAKEVEELKRLAKLLLALLE